MEAVPAESIAVSEEKAAEIVVDQAQAAPETIESAAPYALPTEQLSVLAQAAGLQWVQSDAEKIAAVQAAIAAEPAPVRVPRERPAPVVLDDVPLILVETRKDLADMRLPFEADPARNA